MEDFSMRISVKLKGLLVGVLVLFVALSVVLLNQLRVLASGYDALLQHPVRQADQARVAQVDFKKQVQEWKDILLRGHNPEDLAKYQKQFHEKETKVRQSTLALGGIIQDGEAKRLLVEFQAAHSVLSVKYQAAYDAYVQGGFDFKAADKIVRGQDRSPTDLFDKVVARLDVCVHEAVETQRAEVDHHRNVALGTVGVLLLLLVSAGFAVVASITSRLARLKAVSDRLASADVEGLNIDISGHDEIGEFGESLKGVHAAIKELSTLVAGQASAAS
jgi:methyl-accepting chemotaxis protein